MPISEHYHQALDDACNRLTAEISLARVGRDDGLIPAYSLMSDLVTATEDDAALHGPAVALRARLDALLDSARPFDQGTLDALHALLAWLRPAIEARVADQEVPVWQSTDEGQGIAGVSPAAVETEVPFQEQVLDLNMAENAELLTEFHAEAIDHLAQIESSLLKLDETPDDRDALNQLFRSFHTIKGVSGFLHLTPMHTLTHEVESLLDLARNGELRLNPTIVTAVLQSRDAVQSMIGQITVALEKGKTPTVIVPVGHLIRTVKALVKNPVASVAAPVPPVGSSAPVKTLAPVISMTGAPAEEMGNGVPLPLTAVDTANSGARGNGSSSTVRVNTEKLDSMMNVVGELVIVQSQIAESARGQTDPNSPLSRNIAQLGRITKELQRNAMSLRLMPIKPTFQKMERLARDLARDFGKKVVFQTEGEDTEVDRTVVEEIADPLVHMVRNSLDHGLENVADRIAAGKSEQGSLSLKAYNQGSHIIIELIDDGRGIDPERILRKAIEKGIVSADETPGRDEILQLIFAPGFSTAEKVTSVSGRGVGMDVVKRNIDKLRGKVEILTELGKGTTFKIKLPLTTAIIDGLVVRVGMDRFILPSTSVQMALRPDKESIITVHGRGEVFDHRGHIVPVRRLHRQFVIPGAIENPESGILVIIETHDRITALLVDELVGKQEVVVKNLGGYLANLPGIAGGAILGDGNIALILDLPSLIAA
ncbi:chemotaxis protein CheA [Rariglobus hedericola]|uniref:Chemotaxis protein CheA n=1 Tax=Rariglobus hedericola TaxID=2597822 RepID=A0A556QPW3_9BACT|nr:chemotaxis protein CheA [Rariglobus hedericola]TSJ78667.1 chemotaxis protein CheA [Rariglobus hedericola]